MAPALMGLPVDLGETEETVSKESQRPLLGESLHAARLVLASQGGDVHPGVRVHLCAWVTCQLLEHAGRSRTQTQGQMSCLNPDSSTDECVTSGNLRQVPPPFGCQAPHL